MDLVNEVTRAIDRHLKASGQSPSRFGKLVANDGSLVARIRTGRVTLVMAQKALNFIDGFGAEVSVAGMAANVDHGPAPANSNRAPETEGGAA